MEWVRCSANSVSPAGHAGLGIPDTMTPYGPKIWREDPRPPNAHNSKKKGMKPCHLGMEAGVPSMGGGLLNTARPSQHLYDPFTLLPSQPATRPVGVSQKTWSFLAFLSLPWTSVSMILRDKVVLFLGALPTHSKLLQWPCCRDAGRGDALLQATSASPRLNASSWQK